MNMQDIVKCSRLTLYEASEDHLHRLETSTSKYQKTFKYVVCHDYSSKLLIYVCLNFHVV